MTYRSLCFVFLSTFLLFAASTADADHHNPKWAAWQIAEENDNFALFSGSDEFYTQGLQFRFWRNPSHNSDKVSSFLDQLGTLWGTVYPFKDFEEATGFEIGQHMFTPESLKPVQLIPDDRPYAGWLYGGLLATISEIVPIEDKPIQQLYEVQFGIVGPAAGAEWAQSKFHELIDDEEPMGWDNQLPNEPQVNLFYLWRQRRGPSQHLDFVPHWGFALGTAQIYANGGATLRAGWNITDFGPVGNNNTFSPGIAKNRKSWEFYVFLSADLRAVAHNVFLDGTNFRSSHSVDSDSFVYDLKAGFSWRFRHKYRFTYTFIRRSQEFSPLPVGGGKTSGEHDFGSLVFSYEKRF